MLIKNFFKIITKISFLATLPWIIGANADDQRETAKSTFGSFVNYGLDKSIDKLYQYDWLQRVEIELGVSSEGKPEYDILTVQPLFQTDSLKHTFFTQGRFAYGNDSRTTSNIGLGYRYLTMDDKLLLGLNTFHDYEWPYNHQRVGFGLEVKSSAFELNSNLYEGITGWHSADTGFTERALNGADIELGAQVPYLPWAYVFIKQFFFDGDETQNVDGQSYSLRIRPNDIIEIEAGHTDDNSSNKASEFVQVRAKIKWGQKSKSSIPIIDDRAFKLNESMRDQTLEKVRRENTIRVERKSSATGNVTLSMVRGT